MPEQQACHERQDAEARVVAESDDSIGIADLEDIILDSIRERLGIPPGGDIGIADLNRAGLLDGASGDLPYLLPVPPVPGRESQECARTIEALWQFHHAGL